MIECLLFVLLGFITIIILLVCRLGLLPSDTAWTSTTKWRAESKVDMLLGIKTDDKGRYIHNLLADTDMSLTDKNTGVMNGLGKAKLVDTGLQTTLQEILNLQGQYVIELHAGFVKDTNTDETANEGIAFEKTLGVFLVEGKKLTEGELAMTSV
jgi:hypothetical protein